MMTTRDEVDGTNVAKLAKMARQLFHDDSAVKKDLDEGEVKDVIYAIDSSEVFSYVYLDGLSYLSSDARNADFVLNAGFNEMVLHELLLSGRYSLFMMPSHRLEFRQLNETIGEREIAELGQLLNAAEEKWSSSTKLKDLLQRIPEGHAASKIDPDLAKKIVNEAFNEAPGLLLLARVEGKKSRQRLDFLRSRLSLKPLKDLIEREVPFNIDNSLVEDAFDEFSSRRPNRDSANRVDAYAIAYLTDLLRNSPQHVAIRFVTRSQPFVDVCNALQTRGDVPAIVLQSIRHPRMFSAYVLARSARRQPLELVHQRISAARTFLSTRRRFRASADVETAGSSAGWLLQSEAILEKTIRDIEQIAMLTSISESGAGHEIGGALSYHTDVTKLVDLLRNEKVFQQAVSSRAREVVDNLAGGTMGAARSIAASVIGDPDTDADLSSQIMPSRTKDGKKEAIAVTVAHSAASPVSFSILFYSKYFPARLKKGDSPRAVLTRFVSSGDPDSPYERRLATAYLLGLSRNWTVALEFANAALAAPISEDDTPRHEGHYLRAVARRYCLPWTADNIKLSFEDIVRADTQFAEIYNSVDFRFVHEKGTLLYQAEAVRIESEIRERYAVDTDFVSIWRRVLESDVAPAYKLNAANNLTFYYIMKDDQKSAGQYYEQMLAILTNNGYAQTQLPGTIEDTFLRAQLLTGVLVDPLQRSKAEARLAELSRDEYVKKRPMVP
jgi:hypothetical protein